jgi:glycosyltransferase involved in cell wall biosynthesis
MVSAGDTGVTRPRLLFVSPRFLFPLDEGGKVRTAGILRAMKGGVFDITLAAPAPVDLERFSGDIETTCDRFVFWEEEASSSFLKKRTKKLLLLKDKSFLVLFFKKELLLFRRIFGILGPDPVSVASDKSAAGRRAVAAALAEQCDVLVADFPHSTVLLPPLLPPASVMFTHNVEAEILERHEAVATGWRRLVWRREAAKMRRFEAASLRRFSTVIAVSARDAVALAARYNLPHVVRIDTGVDLEFYRYSPPRDVATTVVFSGALDSRSNIDGIEFMLREVWPLVAQRMPSARMLLVGRNPPPHLVAEAKSAGLNWHFTGTVEDTRPYLAQGDVAAIPLRVGSGTRLKAFEAMAMGLPVVSTTLGVEGLGLAPENYVAADDAAAFAAALCDLLRDTDRRITLAETGRALLEQQYGWNRIGEQFEAICLEAMKAGRK